MNAPTLHIDETALRNATDIRAQLTEICRQIILGLRQYPHFLRVTGLQPTESRDLSVAIARSIAITPPTPPGLSQERLLKVSFTRVRIDPEKVGASANSTAYSRTNESLTMHTDSSYLKVPHRLVMFQFVRTDADGGLSLMTPVADAIKEMDEPLFEQLAQSVFPFGKGNLPILFGKRSAPYIRYYRNQVDNAVDSGEMLDETARGALDRLDQILAAGGGTYKFQAEPGEIIIMDNARVLHGRSGFAPSSDRLMYRLRMHCGCLG